MVNNKKISVILSIVNGGKFFEKTINSLLNQSLDDFELILINRISNQKLNFSKIIQKNEPKIKFIENDERNIAYLRNTALNESNGKYIYFCEDKYTFKNNFLEKFYKTSKSTNSEICICNPPLDITSNNNTLNFKDIITDLTSKNNFINPKKLIPYILCTNTNLNYTFYKKSIFERESFDESHVNSESNLLINSIISSTRISCIPEFLVNTYNQNTGYFSIKLPEGTENALSIFEGCNEICKKLKENLIYDNCMHQFNIYKINQILSYLEFVKYVGCYSYNDPKQEKQCGNDKLDYTRYYGSQSKFLGFNYKLAHEYFDKAKKEFETMNNKEFSSFLSKQPKFFNEISMKKYNYILISDSYEEYINNLNFQNVENLRIENYELNKNISIEKEKIAKNHSELNEEIIQLENKIKNLKNENLILIDENNQLRKEYWKNRDKYDYITNSKSWKYTKWLRKGH